MELGIIIHSALLFLSAFVIIVLLAWALWKVSKKFRQWLLRKYDRLLKICDSFPVGFKSLCIIILILLSSGFFIYWYKSSHDFFDPYLLSENELKLKNAENSSAEVLSNIRRNIWLLAFALFGGGLAIWARVVNQKRLADSAKINRNDRFAKAAEMLDNIKNKISSRGGLYILRDLILEDPRSEYIRCIEVISYWITEHKHKKIKPDRYLLNVVAKISKIRSDHKELENILKRYKKENSLSYWPYFDTINFERAFLRYANLQGVSLKKAGLRRVSLEDANLRNANLEKAKLQLANLAKANLKGANLQNANLRMAFLINTKLKRVNLEGADIKKAFLFGANLTGANLTDANLKGAYLSGAYLDGANLTNAKMQGVVDLTKEQILSAKWRVDDGVGNSDGNPPELPAKLMKYKKVIEWCMKDAEGKVAKAKKAISKKTTVKKVVAKKVKARKTTAKKEAAKKVKARKKQTLTKKIKVTKINLGSY